MITEKQANQHLSPVVTNPRMMGLNSGFSGRPRGLFIYMPPSTVLPFKCEDNCRGIRSAGSLDFRIDPTIQTARQFMLAGG